MKRAKRTRTPLARSIEVKQIIGQSTVPAGPGLFNLVTPASTIVSGTSQSQRIGNKIRVLEVEIWGTFGAQVLGALPISVTMFNQKANSGFTLTDTAGPFVFMDSGTPYPGQIALNNVNGENTYHLKKTFSGYGKLQTYDKDTGQTTGDVLTIMQNNPSASAMSGNIMWYAIKYIDL